MLSGQKSFALLGEFGGNDLGCAMIYIVKSSEAHLRETFAVPFYLLAVGPASMMAKMHYQLASRIPFHSHPNEQSGYILSGRTRVRTHDSEHVLASGDSYVVPANVEHAIEVLEPTKELQMFTPPREDFR